MYSFVQRGSKTPSRANTSAQSPAAPTAAATASVQARLDATLNNSARVASQHRLTRALNQGPRAVTQAKLMQLMSSPVPIPQSGDGQGLTDEEELLQTKPVAQREGMMDDEDLLQPSMQRQALQRREAADDGDAPQQFAATPRAPNTTGMPDSLKQGVESLSGLSLDRVRVHYNSPKPAQMQAHAYAQGSDIHLAPGQQQHLPHEAWHVVQQMQGRVPVLRQLAGQPLNDDPQLEGEADRMGRSALQVQAQGDGAVAQRCGADRQK